MAVRPLQKMKALIHKMKNVLPFASPEDVVVTHSIRVAPSDALEQ